MRSKLFALSALAALLSLSLTSPGWADDKKTDKKGDQKGKDAKEAAPEGPPMTKTPIPLVPEGLRWGMVRADLEKLVDKFIDDDYRPKYKAAGKSGPKLKALDVEVANKKAAFRRNYIDLVPGPTGLDAGPLVGEYTKGNGEAVMPHHRGPGVKIWFFFIGGRLWKTLEEINLVEGGLYGKDMSEAIQKILASVGNTPGRRIEADPDKGIFHDVYDWQDDKTHMRLWDRNGVFVLVREDKVVLANLPNLRKNSGKSSDALDPSVARIIRDEKKEREEKKEKERK
ncbi:MAG: hypothetical protein RMJ98_05650 [Myxococcales bacterium]|nr:hypothetical protein [Polyangiaceae bacterium]MDW8248776.1 hypothetical protein [Myxococcales bacterium]